MYFHNVHHQAKRIGSNISGEQKEEDGTPTSLSTVYGFMTWVKVIPFEASHTDYMYKIPLRSILLCV